MSKLRILGDYDVGSNPVFSNVFNEFGIDYILDSYTLYVMLKQLTCVDVNSASVNRRVFDQPKIKTENSAFSRKTLRMLNRHSTAQQKEEKLPLNME